MTYSSKITLMSVLALWVSMSMTSVSAASPCHICGERGNGAMAYPNVILSNVGKTCTAISLDVALNTPIGSSQCTQEQNKWKGRCCTPGQRPSGRDPPAGLPPQSVPAVQYVGPHPPCNLCRDKDYPFATSMVIIFLYIGEGSCAQYYRYGLEGRIQQHMCDPVKFFSYEPCGCGEFNPYFNPNHPLNQQAQQAPGTNSNTQSSGNTPQQQRTPSGSDNTKDCYKMANGYGGASKAGGCRRLEETSSKPLRGSKKPKKETFDSVAVVEDLVKEDPQE